VYESVQMMVTADLRDESDPTSQVPLLDLKAGEAREASEFNERDEPRSSARQRGVFGSAVLAPFASVDRRLPREQS